LKGAIKFDEEGEGGILVNTAMVANKADLIGAFTIHSLKTAKVTIRRNDIF